MGVGTEKSKIMTKGINDISADFSMNSQKLEEVTSFKYLEQPSARMAPAEQKSALGLPRQWQQWPD